MTQKILSILLVTFVFSGSGVGHATSAEGDVPPIDLGSRREVFVDDHVIANLDNVTRRMHHPTRRETVFTFDKPWEPWSGYVTFLEDGDTYRMYYNSRPRVVPGLNRHTCYAESKDGINWTRPRLGIFEFDGSKQNNILLSHPSFSHNFTPFIDQNPNVDPDSRYKAVAGDQGTKGLYAFASGDGIHWRTLRDEAVVVNDKKAISPSFDSQNTAFWSETEEQYVCYHRAWNEYGFRSISRSTSDDFLHWAEPVEMKFMHQGVAAPMEHLYTNGCLPYYRAPHIYICIPYRLVENRNRVGREEALSLGFEEWFFDIRSDILTDGMLMSSRGGDVFQRTFLEAFIRPPTGIRNWLGYGLATYYGIIQTGEDEMSIYAGGQRGFPNMTLSRYTLRLDGFASVHASHDGGSMTTKYLTFTGSDLYLNYSTSAAGSILVEIQDEHGNPIGPLSLQHSIPLFGNEIHEEVKWSKSKDSTVRLEHMNGRAVRIRFVLQDADLYSFKFE